MLPKVVTSELTFGPCQRCEGILVQRTNRKTQHTFIGCSRWPHCDYTKRGGSNPGAPKVFDDCGVYNSLAEEVYDNDDAEPNVWDEVFSPYDWGDND